MEDKLLLDALDLIDDVHLHEALSMAPRKSKRDTIAKLSVIAACLAVVVSLAFYVPYNLNKPPQLPPIVPPSVTDTPSVNTGTSDSSSYTADTEVDVTGEPTEVHTDVTTDEPALDTTDTAMPDTFSQASDSTAPIESTDPYPSWYVPSTESTDNYHTDVASEPIPSDSSFASTEFPTNSTTSSTTQTATKEPTEEPTETPTSEADTSNNPALDDPPSCPPNFQYCYSVEEFIEWVNTEQIDPENNFWGSWTYFIGNLRKLEGLIIPESLSEDYTLTYILVSSNLKSIECVFNNDWNQIDIVVDFPRSEAYAVDVLESNIERFNENCKKYYLNYEDFLYRKTQAVINGEVIPIYCQNGAERIDSETGELYDKIGFGADFVYKGHIIRIDSYRGLLGKPWDNSYLDMFSFNMVPIKQK